MHLLAFVLALAAAPMPRPETLPVAHNFHVSYGKLAVEGRTATLVVRFFRDDLEETMRVATGTGSYTMRPAPDVEGHFLAYLAQHFAIEAGSTRLAPRVVGSGEKEDMWWYRVQFDAPADLRTFTVRNTLLFNTFEDQRNIVKVMHFPEGKSETLYFTEGAEAFTVRF